MKDLIVIAGLLCVCANIGADPVFDPIEDDPNLPRVLLIGDSISIGYTIPVRTELSCKANVHRVPANCMFSANGLANIKNWLGSGKWDVIHFNFGIWDTHLLADDGTILSAEDEANGRKGKLRTTISEYKNNLSDITDIMLSSGARLIWASSTPLTCRSKARSGDIDKYNLAASVVMKQKGIPINDLNHYIEPHLKTMQTEDGCHFNPQGDLYLGKRVTQAIMSVLDMDQWQPDNFSAKPLSSQIIAGRNVVRYEFRSLKRWGYSDNHTQYFYIVEPKTGNKNPLMVCLHSAGGTGESEMPSNVEKVAEAGDEFAGLIPNSGDGSEWWWGAHGIEANSVSYKNKLTPVEARVLDSVEWAIRHYDINRNRVYLRGISMGGSGTLGIGMPNGDIFAAILAGVPAGTKHSLRRLTDLRTEKTNKIGMESVPPAIVFFSQKDIWSKEMDEWLDFIAKNKLSAISAWGPWGHENHYEMTDPAAYEFPWLEIRKDQAYPAFTNASANNKYPGFQSDADDQNGQMNAYFRWKIIKDEPKSLVIEIRLVQNTELSSPVPIPDSVSVDMTIRRIQRFSANDGIPCDYIIRRAEKVIGSGMINPAGKTLEFTGLTVTSEPINIEFAKQENKQ